MDELDRRILDALQDSLPLTHRPFLALARKLKLPEADVLTRIQRMVEQGYMRRISPVLHKPALDRVSTLVAASVPKGRIEAVARIVNGYDGVSHNYLRAAKGRRVPFNLWFTLSAPSEPWLARTLKEIERRAGVPLHSLPALRRFKIGVRFDLQRKERPDGCSNG